MQMISDLDTLSAKIAECNDVLTNQSDDALRAMFQTFHGDFSHAAPADPFSDAYRDYQLTLHAHLCGKVYSPLNERTLFDVATYLRRPYPYNTASPATAGDHFLAIGFMLRLLKLPPGARIVEFGPGWGHTTIALAMLGFRVTAVDIEPNFCELLRRRAAQHQVEIDVVEADFFWAERVREPYDAAIFFESFHHCHDHLRLLRALRDAVKPDGQVVFAAEPIVPDYVQPWGISMDGSALWSMANFGWLELGFDEAYFQKALAHTGWAAEKHASADLWWARVWLARRAEAVPVEVAVVEVVPELSPEPLPEIVVVAPAALPPDAPSETELALGRELAWVYGSTSWRITAPLRALKRLLG